MLVLPEWIALKMGEEVSANVRLKRVRLPLPTSSKSGLQVGTQLVFCSPLFSIMFSAIAAMALFVKWPWRFVLIESS